MMRVVRDWTFRVFAAVVRRLYGSRAAKAMWRAPGARRVYDRLAALRPDTVTVDGHTIRLDTTDSLLLAVNGTYEASELALFESCVRAGDTVFDVGAHIGLYTLAAARAVGPTGRVVAFEPSPDNYALLVANIDANGYRNVTTHCAAVADRTGDAVLILSPTNSGDHQLRASGDGVEVETVRLDDLDVIPQVVKMDVQGAEPFVLAGAGRLLEAEDLILFTEVSPHHLGTDGAAAYVKQLRGAGFELHQINETSGGLSPLGAIPDAGFVNLLCVKGQAGRARFHTLRLRNDASRP